MCQINILIYIFSFKSHFAVVVHSRPQSLRSFWPATGIESSVDTSCMGTYIAPKYIFHTYILHLLEKLVLLEVLFSLS